MRANEETSSLKYPATNGTKGSAPAQYLSYESIKNQCWWHQSTTNTRSHSSYCEEHQYQCAEHLQAIHKASTSNERNINVNAFIVNINAYSINSQYAEHQQPMYTVSTTNERNIKAQSINNQCVLHQQPMRIASDSLMLGFSRTKTFTLSSMPPIPVILRGAKGEVAESILPESTLS